MLAQHDSALRGAVEGHGGRLVKSTGDGCHRPVRRPLRPTVWPRRCRRQLALPMPRCGPTGVHLRVRMGVHAGEATERDGDWFGAEVNRTARVMAAAHGGQILCTEVVGDQVRGDLSARSISGSTGSAVAAVAGDVSRSTSGCADRVPTGAVHSMPTASNLPYELSSFVGRDADQLRSLADLVGSPRGRCRSWGWAGWERPGWPSRSARNCCPTYPRRGLVL